MAKSSVDHIHLLNTKLAQLDAALSIHNLTMDELKRVIELFRSGDLIDTRDRVALIRAIRPPGPVGG